MQKKPSNSKKLKSNKTNDATSVKLVEDRFSWCPYQTAIFTGQPIPNHPNYISENCVKLIMNLFSDFQLDQKEFLDKISLGITSNNNEAIHSLLFRMVKKTESCGIDIMRLASALAVIRFNNVFNGIQRVYDALGIQLSDKMREYFSRLDSHRVKNSFKILPQQRMRYLKKQGRGTKVRKQIQKHGKGYTP